MAIYKALLKHGYAEFRLEILEYCSGEILLKREQHYFDKCKPEYNILKIAGSSLGHKHSKETITKFKEIAQNKYYSDEEKARVSKLNLYRTEESRIKDKERILKINKKKRPNG